MSGSSEDLAAFVASTSGESALRIEEDLGEGFVRLRVSEAERRQAKHDIRCAEDALIELLRNARDAHASSIFVASAREGSVRHLVVLDNGDGVPASMQRAIFEPRVTSKLQTMTMDAWGIHGRGMALYSIAQNAASAVVVSSGTGLGTSIAVDIDCSSLPEKDDQSSWPVLDESAQDDLAVRDELRGPHNLLRTAAEFALSCPLDVDVYVGSPADIVATLRENHFGREAPSARSLRNGSRLDPQREIRKDPKSPTHLVGSIPDVKDDKGVCDRLAGVCGARELVRRSETLGLRISERTSHRIISGEIRPLQPIRQRYLGSASDARAGSGSSMNHGSLDSDRKVPDLLRDRRTLKVSDQDAREFSDRLADAFKTLSDRYYLEAQGSPRFRVRGDQIIVTFDFKKMD
jgi:hypothetical protein